LSVRVGRRCGRGWLRLGLGRLGLLRLVLVSQSASPLKQTFWAEKKSAGTETFGIFLFWASFLPKQKGRSFELGRRLRATASRGNFQWSPVAGTIKRNFQGCALPFCHPGTEKTRPLAFNYFFRPGKTGTASRVEYGGKTS